MEKDLIMFLASISSQVKGDYSIKREEDNVEVYFLDTEWFKNNFKYETSSNGNCLTYTAREGNITAKSSEYPSKGEDMAYADTLYEIIDLLPYFPIENKEKCRLYEIVELAWTNELKKHNVQPAGYQKIGVKEVEKDIGYEW